MPNLAEVKFKPGTLLDLQVNGGIGVDFSKPGLSVEEVLKVAKMWYDRGTSHFLATIITAPKEVYLQNVRTIAKAMKEDGGQGIIGIHLEGPHLSPTVFGSHPPEYVIPPDRGLFKSIFDAAEGKVLMTTLAPDVQGACEFISELNQMGVVVSIGHHAANRQQILKALEAGASGFTHMGNGWKVSGWDAKSSEAITMATAKNTFGMMIADRQHVPLDLIDTIHELKGPDHFILVSDASALAQAEPGEYQIHGGLTFKVANAVGRFGVEDRLISPLAGSYQTLFRTMQFLHEDLPQIPVSDIWKAVNSNPVRFLQMALQRLGIKELNNQHSTTKVVYDQQQFKLESNK